MSPAPDMEEKSGARLEKDLKAYLSKVSKPGRLQQNAFGMCPPYDSTGAGIGVPMKFIFLSASILMKSKRIGAVHKRTHHALLSNELLRTIFTGQPLFWFNDDDIFKKVSADLRSKEPCNTKYLMRKECTVRGTNLPPQITTVPPSFCPEERVVPIFSISGIQEWYLKKCQRPGFQPRSTSTRPYTPPIAMRNGKIAPLTSSIMVQVNGSSDFAFELKVNLYPPYQLVKLNLFLVTSGDYGFTDETVEWKG
ncbi:hypothetical protein GGU10DRAFT_434179 [Lentinula aff. detonsa]|uniref:Uncharacterized protein n=1 Tax=Lentinula aff. detonsa TaxID=2804958 RepID=A0AA38L5U2_9AGAR|nr:hypothetical protein GGU10DRAFT_434179 [Lentinula aff. detonsa]